MDLDVVLKLTYLPTSIAVSYHVIILLYHLSRCMHRYLLLLMFSAGMMLWLALSHSLAAFLMISQIIIFIITEK